MKDIKIAYIGGGSKLWARVFMYDLALTAELCGEIALYDIDLPAAERNKAIGAQINKHESCVSKWNYVVYDKIEDALSGADFVVLSILPGTFDEMAVDVHAPEKYGIYQAVGDTVGPGGVLRSMRTVPLYEGFARAIKDVCPNAWVINFTNPMSICTKTLFDVFPEIKAFGCCHEVFHAQTFLCGVLDKMLGVKGLDRHDIYTDASGVNHFTWISEASYKGIDILGLLPEFIDKFYNDGYARTGQSKEEYLGVDPFMGGNKVKMDMYKRYGVLGAAGDRHLVEFMPNTWYLKNPQVAKDWLYSLTTVDFRRQQQKEKIEESIAMGKGEMPIDLYRSDEEAVDLMLALLGEKTIVSNVNMPNLGQMPDMPLGAIVETNCVFSSNSVKPIVANKLPNAVNSMVARNLYNIETCYHGIKTRDMEELFASFVNQPLCGELSLTDAKELFKTMIEGTKKYLTPFYKI